MTYCLGILVRSGLVMASDSRSNAGVDDITLVRKLALFTVADDRVIAILSAGNLATTQAVVTTLKEAAGSGDAGRDLHAAATLFDAANIVGTVLRETVARDRKAVTPYGDPTGSFLIGGQIAGERPRLFQVYSAGNFIEATDRAFFLQIGETKYGKPILDRALAFDTPLDVAAKLALLSFDATLRSDLSVGLPIDMLRYDAGSLSAAHCVTIEPEDAYWLDLRKRYSDGLLALVEGLPAPAAVMGRAPDATETRSARWLATLFGDSHGRPFANPTRR